jgi:hypothetical protein
MDLRWTAGSTRGPYPLLLPSIWQHENDSIDIRLYRQFWTRHSRVSPWSVAGERILSEYKSIYECLTVFWTWIACNLHSIIILIGCSTLASVKTSSRSSATDGALTEPVKNRVRIVPPDVGSVPELFERGSNNLKPSSVVNVSIFYVIPSNSTSMSSSSFDINLGGSKQRKAFEDDRGKWTYTQKYWG